MTWLRRFADGLSSASPMEPATPSPPKASIPRREEVPEMSPARLLAKSLTDCTTRDEWERKNNLDVIVSCGWSSVYVNERRNLSITDVYAMYAGRTISTDFTLSKVEQDIVGDALTAFNQHRTEERQKAALARLIAPASAIPSGTAETPKSGSVRSKGSAARRETPK